MGEWSAKPSLRLGPLICRLQWPNSPLDPTGPRPATQHWTLLGASPNCTELPICNFNLKTAVGMVNFDDINDWAPKLAAILSPYVSDSVGLKLAAAAPEFIEDARDLLFDLTVRDEIIDATLAWIRTTKIAGYHGSRLTDAELASVRTDGLIPLKAEMRRSRLIRALSPSPEWPGVAGQLDAAIKAHGSGATVGRREDQVHLTLSRVGLTNGFNHYLTHGAEFDQHVANALLGPAGKELLSRDGEPRVIRVAVPGPLALDAAHPYFSIKDIRNRGDIPNLVNEFLMAWSYRWAYPGFQSRTLRIDCGMIFRSIVPGAWIMDVDTLAL